MSLVKRILTVLAGIDNGMTAREIARVLGGEDVSVINSVLYKHKDRFVQGDGYAWRVIPDQPKPTSATSPTRRARSTTRPAELKEGSEVPTRTPNPAPPANPGPPPSCPKCAGPTQLRWSARNAQWFWGCPKFPACKGAASLAPQVGDGAALGPAGSSTATAVPKRNTGAALPRAVTFAGVSPGHRVTYVENIAVPRPLVSPCHELLSPPLRRALSHWRIDLPSTLSQPGPQPPAWLGLARTVLKRGTITATSATLADELQSLAGGPELDWAGVAAGGFKASCEAVACLDRPAPLDPGCFDSEEEREFYGWYIGTAIPPHVRGWCSCQVSLSSMSLEAAEAAPGQRTDFVIAHPRLKPLVVEIDGDQHTMSTEVDARRDRMLSEGGFTVVRIPASEVRDHAGPAIDRLADMLRAVPGGDLARLEPLAKFILLCKRAHQIQVGILEWLNVQRGRLSRPGPIRVRVTLDEVTKRVALHTDAFIAAVLQDLSGLVADFCAARSEKPEAVEFVADDAGPDIRLSFDLTANSGSSRGDIDASTAYIRDAYLPVAVSAGLPKGVGTPRGACDRSGCERVLARVFGFSSFREGQFEALSRALGGEDSIVLLPTGSGKSAAFQLASLLRGGVCVVVDPILSLIDDQIENLRLGGIDRVTQVTSLISPEERHQFLELMRRGEFLFVYVAPERFQDEEFRRTLRTLTAHSPVSLVAIDEAHCVSEWGHDFRPAYLNLARNAREFAAYGGKPPPIMALTGTASHSVLKDVQRELGIGNYESIITPKTFDRAELSFSLHPCRSMEKQAILEGLLHGLPERFGLAHDQFFAASGGATHAGLVFCPHAKGEHGVVDRAVALRDLLQTEVQFYSGGNPRGGDDAHWAVQKREIASAFKRNRFPLLACTHAFGMGIDKPNIRYTIHWNLPASVEAFYQEAGRAGRDRRHAHCMVLFSNDQPERSRELLDPNTGVDRVQEVMQTVSRAGADDVTRMLFFHANSFKGVQAELDSVDTVLEELGVLDSPRRVEVQFTDETKVELERALHRLLLLGVVRDYTVEYRKKQFVVEIAAEPNDRILASFYRYIAGYQRQRAVAARARAVAWLSQPRVDFIRRLTREVVEFVYSVVERGRRRSLSEMLRILESAKNGEDLRRGVLDALEKSQFSAAIAELPEADLAGLSGVSELVDRIRSSIDAAEVRGETGRALAAYPDLPGLLLLRALAECLVVAPDTTAISENARAAASMAASSYAIEQHAVVAATLNCAALIADERPDHADLLIRSVADACPDTRAALRQVLADGPERMRGRAARWILDALNTRLQALLGNEA